MVIVSCGVIGETNYKRSAKFVRQSVIITVWQHNTYGDICFLVSILSHVIMREIKENAKAIKI